MYAFTTQGFTVTITGEDLSDANVSVDFAQFNKSGSVQAAVSITDPTVTVDGSNSTVECAMSQAQSGLFAAGLAYAQVNAVWSDNSRKATEWLPFTVQANLRAEVVEYA